MKKNQNIMGGFSSKKKKKSFVLGWKLILTPIWLWFLVHVHKVFRDSIFSCCPQHEPERYKMEKEQQHKQNEIITL